VKTDPLLLVAGYVAWFVVLLVVVWSPAVGDWGVWAVAEFGLVGAGGQGGGDVVPDTAVVAGFGGEQGNHALGLVDEAGQEGDGGDGVAEPGLAASASWWRVSSMRS
jgi:hypothetical protein